MNKKWHPKVKKFVDYVRKETSKNRITVYFSPHYAIKDTDDIHADGLYGYFISPSGKSPGKIVIASKLPMPTVIHTLAHEFAHFLQWKHNKPCYINDNFIAYEKDAENKALQLMEKFELPINMKVRKKHSNSYVSTLKTIKQKMKQYGS